MGLVDQIFRAEARPTRLEPIPIPPPGNTPIEKALTGLCLAINAVSESDYALHVRDFDDRRNRLLDWREHLRTHPIPSTEEASTALIEGRISTSEALFGTARWSEMLDDLHEMLMWHSNRQLETARKLKTAGKALHEAQAVRTRGNQRTAEIVQRAEAEIAALTADDDAGKARIIAQAQQEVRTMSEVATSRTNALTREVLDLDENTATIDTTEWLQRHGLE
jgi:hypothetical protein